MIYASIINYFCGLEWIPPFLVLSWAIFSSFYKQPMHKGIFLIQDDNHSKEILSCAFSVKCKKAVTNIWWAFRVLYFFAASLHRRKGHWNGIYVYTKASLPWSFLLPRLWISFSKSRCTDCMYCPAVQHQAGLRSSFLHLFPWNKIHVHTSTTDTVPL